MLGNTPGAPNRGIAPLPGELNRLFANLLTEYVAGSGQSWYHNYARSLGHGIDDVTVTFGSDLYDRMMVDSQVAGTINGFRAKMIASGLALRPAVTDDEADGYDQAVKLQQQYERVLAETDPDTWLWDFSSACYEGNRVAELVFDDATVNGLPRLHIARVSLKPRWACAFVVDVYWNTIGLLGRVPGVGMPVMVGSLLTKPADVANLIPREKFAVLSWRPENGDPRGTSLLRPGFDDWNRLQQIKIEEMKWLAGFAVPAVIGKTPPGARAEIPEDALGNPDALATALLSPEQRLHDALVQWRGGFVAAFPAGTEVDIVQAPSGAASPFTEAKADCRRQIVYSITSQTLATTEGEHQARAAAEVHQDTGDVIVALGKRAIEGMVNRDIVRRMVALNEGEALLPLAPKATLGELEEHNFAADATGMAALQTSGYLDPSMYPQTDKQLGLRGRDPASIQAAIDRKNATPPPPQQFPGIGPGKNTLPNAQQPDKPQAGGKPEPAGKQAAA